MGISHLVSLEPNCMQALIVLVLLSAIVLYYLNSLAEQVAAKVSTTSCDCFSAQVTHQSPHSRL